MKIPFLPLLLLLFTTTYLFGQEVPMVYNLAYSGQSDYVTIHIRFEKPIIDPVLVIPQSAPGTYEITRYIDFIDQVSATDVRGKTHAGVLGDGSFFKFPKAEAITSITYQVDIRDMETRLLGTFASSKLRQNYLGVLGYSVFGFVEGTETWPIDLGIITPETWPIFTTISPKITPEKGTLELRISKFAQLADAQFLMGTEIQLHQVPEAPIPLFIALYSEAPIAIEKVGVRALDALNRLQEYFGFVPMPHYTLCYEFTQPISERHDYGFSIEHLNSMTASLDVSQIDGADSNMRKFRSMIHHMGHAWIPLRAYGQGYSPFAWQPAPLQDTIWLNEGFIWYVTTYHCMEDTNLDFYHNIVNNAPEFIRKLSLKELSLLGSTQYSLDFRIGKNLFARGALLAHALDQHIINQSAGKKSLLDVIKYLMDYTKTHLEGFRYEQFPNLLKQATTVDCDAIWEAWQKAP